jgi:hypothetical protein
LSLGAMPSDAEKFQIGVRIFENVICRVLCLCRGENHKPSISAKLL